jgi:hypothetical protein
VSSTVLLVGVLPAALMDTHYVRGLFKDMPTSLVELPKVSMVCCLVFLFDPHIYAGWQDCTSG